MTFTYELDLNIVKIYLCTKNEVTRSRLSKVKARTETHRHRQTDRQTGTCEENATERITTAVFASDNNIIVPECHFVMVIVS